MPEVTKQDQFETHFPILFMNRRYTGIDPLLQSLANLIRRLESTKENWNPNSERQYNAGFSTKIDFLELDRSPVPTLRRLLEDSFRTYLQRSVSAGVLDIGSLMPDEFMVTMFGWAVVLRENEWICPHIHKGGAFAGVFYIHVPDLPVPQGCIEFINPFGIYSDVTGRARQETTRIMPAAGQLLMFPSHYMHLVYPFQGPGERIAVSFTVDVEAE